MPDAIAAEYAAADANAHYFALGPIPPTAYLTSIYGIARSTVAGNLTLSHVLTLQDAADVGAHAAGRRLLARATTVVNGQPAYILQHAANTNISWSFPLNLFLAGGANWIITYALNTGGLNVWSIMLTVGWLNLDEYARMYGLKPAVTVIGAPRPGLPLPPGPPVEPVVEPI